MSEESVAILTRDDREEGLNGRLQVPGCDVVEKMC